MNQKKGLTQERLKELLHYDPEAGIFTRTETTGNRSKKGAIAGGVNKINDYRRIMIDNQSYRAARLAFLYMEGYFPEHDIDHINRIKSDDRWENLRHVSRQCNMRNAGIPKDNKSGVIGVSWCTKYNVWTARIGVDGKSIFIGQSISKARAVKKRWQAEVKYGFPGCNTTSTAYQYLLRRGLVDV